MMVMWQPKTNLRDYVANKPPAVTFFLCLLFLGISFTFLGFYSSNHILPNPDVVQDWNRLLSTIAEYHLCETNITGFTQLVTPKKDQKEKTFSDNSLAVINVQVPLVLSSNSKGQTQTSSICLHTSFTASQLHLAGNNTFSLTLDFSANENSACLTVKWPYVLSMPPACPENVVNKKVVYTKAKKVIASTQKCHRLQAVYDPTLRVMLTKEDQIATSRHLLEVAVVLLGVCLILFLFVSLTH